MRDEEKFGHCREFTSGAMWLAACLLTPSTPLSKSPLKAWGREVFWRGRVSRQQSKPARASPGNGENQKQKQQQYCCLPPTAPRNKQKGHEEPHTEFQERHGPETMTRTRAKVSYAKFVESDEDEDLEGFSDLDEDTRRAIKASKEMAVPAPASEKTESTSDNGAGALPPTPKVQRGRGRKAATAAAEVEEGSDNGAWLALSAVSPPNDSAAAPDATGRHGRGGKQQQRATAKASDSDSDDSSSSGSEDDEDDDEDDESVASSSDDGAPSKKRGRNGTGAAGTRGGRGRGGKAAAPAKIGRGGSAAAAAEKPKMPADTTAKKPTAAAARGKGTPTATNGVSASAVAAGTAEKGSVSEKAAPEMVLKYLNDQNRPYSLVNIFDNLHGAIKKPLLTKVVDTLADAGKISSKEFGKQKVYWARQDQFPATDAEELKVMEAEIETLSRELKESEMEARMLTAERNRWNNSMTVEQLRGEIERLEKENNVMQEDIDTILSGAKPIDPEEKKAITSLHEKVCKEFKRRRKMCLDMISCLADSLGTKPSELIDNIGIDSDEAAGFQFNPQYAPQNPGFKRPRA